MRSVSGTPRTGFGAIAEALAEAAAADAGVSFHLGAAIDSIVVADDHAEIRTPDAVVRAARVVSTIPNDALVGASRGPRPPYARQPAACDTGPRVLVYLVHDRPQYTPFDAHYFPGLDVTVARLSEPKNYRDGPDPRRPHGAVCRDRRDSG